MSEFSYSTSIYSGTNIYDPGTVAMAGKWWSQTGTVSVLMAFIGSSMPRCVHIDGYPVFKEQGLEAQPLPCIPQGQGTQCPGPNRASTHCFDFFPPYISFSYSRTSYIWNHTVCALLCAASLLSIMHWRCRHIIACCSSVLLCTECMQRVSPFSSSWTPGLLPLSSACPCGLAPSIKRMVTEWNWQGLGLLNDFGQFNFSDSQLAPEKVIVIIP